LTQRELTVESVNQVEPQGNHRDGSPPEDNASPEIVENAKTEKQLNHDKNDERTRKEGDAWFP
jgi:hypothetical protein